MNKVVLLALLTDLLTPILIWKAGLPAESRYLSSALLAAVLLDGYALLVQQRRFPAALWAVVALSIVGIPQALLNGQSLGATIWGWWLMFRFPLVGLYAYLQPRYPRQFPSRLLRWSILLLCFEAAVQVGQYITGEQPGDNLAGSFGMNGTGHLVLVALWVFALALGEWIARGGLTRVALVTGLGAMSSVLGEMKLFPFAAGAMAAIGLAIHLHRRHRLAQLLPYAFVLGAVLAIFPSVYNGVVPGAQMTPFSDYLDPAVLDRYLNFTELRASGTYDVGRVSAVVYAWEQISDDPISTAVGDGLGARGESKTLGTAGVDLLAGDLGLFTGGSLVVILGELGVLGLLTVLGFMLWVAFSLWQGTASGAAPDSRGLQYGLLIYTLLWPLWIWYNTSWTLPVPMLLYWTTLGHCLSELRQGGFHQPSYRPSLAPLARSNLPSPIQSAWAGEFQATVRPGTGMRRNS